MLCTGWANRNSRVLLAGLAVALCACGGRAQRGADGSGAADTSPAGSGGTGTTGSGGSDATGSGGTGTTGSGGTGTTGSGGTGTTGSGGSDATGSGGTTAEGASGATPSEAGSSASDTNKSFGDFDEYSLEHPPPGGPGSSSFYWEMPGGGVHLGNWFVSSAGPHVADAPIDDVVPPRAGSTRAVHVSGADYGVELDVFAQLDHPGGKPVDLSGFSGLTFWVRLAGESTTLDVVMNDGSLFLPAKDDYSALPFGTFTVSEGWQRFAFDFDPARVSVVSIDFVVRGGGDAVDLWIDDVTLVCRGTCQ